MKEKLNAAIIILVGRPLLFHETLKLFYKNWNKYMSKHDAFVLAKKSIMTRYDMPKYWGSFILITTE